MPTVLEEWKYDIHSHSGDYASVCFGQIPEIFTKILFGLKVEQIEEKYQAYRTDVLSLLPELVDKGLLEFDFRCILFAASRVQLSMPSSAEIAIMDSYIVGIPLNQFYLDSIDIEGLTIGPIVDLMRSNHAVLISTELHCDYENKGSVDSSCLAMFCITKTSGLKDDALTELNPCNILDLSKVDAFFNESKMKELYASEIKENNIETDIFQAKIASQTPAVLMSVTERSVSFMSDTFETFKEGDDIEVKTDYGTSVVKKYHADDNLNDFIIENSYSLLDVDLCSTMNIHSFTPQTSSGWGDF